MKPLSYFTARIGKTIYRNPVDCPCPTCVEAGQLGIVVADEQHAEYLEMVHRDLQIEYRDEK